jgi:hypothetical protein
MAQTQSRICMMLAFGFGLHRTQKNFLIIVFEPLLKYRHDTLTYLKNRRNIQNGITPAAQNQSEKRDKMGQKNPRISCIL